MGYNPYKRNVRLPRGPTAFIVALSIIPLITAAYIYALRITAGYNNEHSHPHVCVSYAYFEKDEIQQANFDFFITLGMGVGSQQPPIQNVGFTIVIMGKICSPCAQLDPLLTPAVSIIDEISSALVGDNIIILHRSANEGMDFGAHNTTLKWHKAKNSLSKYSYFIFLNSSTRGPFVPSYMPFGWQWPMAYIQKLTGDVHAVSSSLVCLPECDSGGPGPKIESWAFAIDTVGLATLIEESVFELRSCKLCKEGIVVRGEYGLTTALMKHGHNVDTLMSKYDSVDWRQRRHWNCNNNAHPSRHGTYDGISMHPFETVFLKASWHVGEPFVDKYSQWMLAQARGEVTTQGAFDERMYRYAISLEAELSHHVDQCYQVFKGNVTMQSTNQSINNGLKGR